MPRDRSAARFAAPWRTCATHPSRSPPRATGSAIATESAKNDDARPTILDASRGVPRKLGSAATAVIPSATRATVVVHAGRLRRKSAPHAAPAQITSERAPRPLGGAAIAIAMAARTARATPPATSTRSPSGRQRTTQSTTLATTATPTTSGGLRRMADSRTGPARPGANELREDPVGAYPLGAQGPRPSLPTRGRARITEKCAGSWVGTRRAQGTSHEPRNSLPQSRSGDGCPLVPGDRVQIADDHRLERQCGRLVDPLHQAGDHHGHERRA